MLPVPDLALYAAMAALSLPAAALSVRLVLRPPGPAGRLRRVLRPTLARARLTVLVLVVAVLVAALLWARDGSGAPAAPVGPGPVALGPVV